MIQNKNFTTKTRRHELKKSSELFVLVVTLLVHGCPVQAVVAALGLDARTVRRWLGRAGEHSQAVHDHRVTGNHLDRGQVQGDEIRIKTQGGVVWLAMALMVSTRLWLGGVVSRRRDYALSHHLVNQVRQLALERPLLFAADGYASSVRAARSAFRTSQHTGQRGRPKPVAWAELAIGQVVKQRHPRNPLAGPIERRIVQGTQALVSHLLQLSQPGGQINTAYIAPRGHPLNATFRQRLSWLARRPRALVRTQPTVEAAMWLLGCVYDFCSVHETLATTPAMAAGLTDHRWTLHALLQGADDLSAAQAPWPPSQDHLCLRPCLTTLSCTATTNPTTEINPMTNGNNGDRNFIGRYRGTVVSNIDPENTGRLLVSVPDVVGSEPCLWAAPSPAFAGTQQGLFAIPPINGGVWIEFEQGDPDYPIWTGSFRGSAAETPAMALAAPPAAPPVVMQSIAQNRMIVSGVPADGVTLETSRGPAGPRIQITQAGIIISDGAGGMITITGGIVTINQGALIIK